MHCQHINAQELHLGRQAAQCRHTQCRDSFIPQDTVRPHQRVHACPRKLCVLSMVIVATELAAMPLSVSCHCSRACTEVPVQQLP